MNRTLRQTGQHGATFPSPQQSSRAGIWQLAAQRPCPASRGLLLRPLRRLGYTLSEFDFYPEVGLTTLWQPQAVMPEFSWDVVARYDWPTELHKQISVYLGPQKKAVAKRERKRMGLPDDAWYVCLHVRESGFHKDNMVERNATIANYVDAIREITARGGWVVRMGDPTMTRLPPMSKVIDYPFTASKSYAMDLYLISECHFYIGMQSGIYDVAMLFQRPMIITNMASWLYPFPHRSGDIGVLKHIFSRSRQRFLSVREWIAEPFNATSFSLLGDDYVLHENEPAELRNAVREFLDRNADGEPKPLQREYNELRLSRGRALLEQPIVPKDAFWDTHQRYRLASRLDSAFGLISDDYLQKNWARNARNPA